MKRWQPICLVGFRLALGTVMIGAGGAKVFNLAGLARVVEAYNVLPPILVIPLAVVIPWLEILCGLGLLLGWWTRSSALLAVLLLTSFGIALGINVYRDTDIACGCFGLDSSRGSLEMALVQDGLLLAMALVVLFSRCVPFSLDERLQ